MSLPTTGQLNWGVPLNDYIANTVLATANQALTAINNHATGADPHGDRAYAAGLVQPFVSGVNLPSGFVQLNGSGQVPSNLLPVGAFRTNLYDVKTYGTVGNGSTDDYTALQAALTAANTAGGGEVWVGDGTYASSGMLIIGPNTWLHMSPGATIKRITPPAGAAPSVMLSNVSFTTNATPGGSGILITGGKFDSVGSGLTSACTPILLVQVTSSAINGVQFNGVAGSPLIELNGSKIISVGGCTFGGTATTATAFVPAIRLNSTSTSTTPSGLAAGAYNNAVCQNIVAAGSILTATGANAPVNRFLGADLRFSSFTHSFVTVANCISPGGTKAAQPQADSTGINSLHTFGNLFNTSTGTELDLTTSEGAAFIGPTANGGPIVAVSLAGWLAYAQGVAGNVTPETWHNVGIPSGWTDKSGNSTGFRYALMAFGVTLPMVAVSVNMQTPGSAPADGHQIGTVGAAYVPSSVKTINLASNNSPGINSNTPHFTVDTSGNIKCYGMLGSATVTGTGFYELD